MSQNGQTHFKNLAANAARFLKCVWQFWDIMHLRVNNSVVLDFITKDDLVNKFFATQCSPVANSSTLTNFSYKAQKQISNFKISEQSTWME